MRSINHKLRTLAFLALLGGMPQANTARAEDEKHRSPVATADTVKKDAEVGVAGRDGFYVSAGQTFVSRNGGVERVTSVHKFENGAKVSPDGTFTMADGQLLTLRSDQFVTFSGKMETVASREATATTSSATPLLSGILMTTGKAFLVENGRSQPLSSDFKLRNGAIAQPDGLVRMPDGTSFQLGQGQLITFAGDLQNPGGNPSGASPVATFPRTPGPASTDGSQATVSGRLTPSPPVIQPGQGASAR